MKKILFKKIRMSLLDLNGIGPETADDIDLYSLEKPTFVIDEYTKILFLRLGVFPAGNKYNNWQNVFINNIDSDTVFSQHYHALIVEHCKQICSKIPSCQGCPLNEICDYYQDNFKIL